VLYHIPVDNLLNVGNVLYSWFLSCARVSSLNTFTCWQSWQAASLRFNGNFPGGPGLAGTRMSPFWILLELRIMAVVVTVGAIRRAKLQSKHHHQQINTQLFYRPNVLPVVQPTVSTPSL